MALVPPGHKKTDPGQRQVTIQSALRFSFKDIMVLANKRVVSSYDRYAAIRLGKFSNLAPGRTIINEFKV